MSWCSSSFPACPLAVLDIPGLEITTESSAYFSRASVVKVSSNDLVPSSFDTFSHERSSASIPTWMEIALAARYPPYTSAHQRSSILLQEF